ncbi:MFS transporter [Erythrobacter sp.]|uniref:MFS transporter n=1 Tax=Erythrobacter sp. TaxID=1042 RepID=UPI001B02796F|nr:MFS transporter [Erythrobacter sp.]MBO6526958.1 MFS transporter [Erythrobacter sp.]MBO6528630.1 MFS transporter [Erythrobacter sp.]
MTTAAFAPSKVDPTGILAGIMLSFLATAGLFYVNIMAAIVDGLITGLGLSESEAGLIGSANIYGASLGALVAVVLIKAVPWRPAAYVLLISLIALDLISMPIRDADALLAVRAIHGLVGGMLVGIAFGVIARTAQADRTFGILLFVQFGLGGLGVMTLPQLVPIYGTQALFIALALFSFASLVMLTFLPAYPPKPLTVSEGGTVEWRPLFLTLGAIFLFQAANMGLLAYIFRLGIAYGLERTYTSYALGLATWVALLGPLCVILIGTKYGRFLPLALVMLLTLGGTAIFHFSANPLAYLVANCGTGITWGMVMAYLLGMASQFDGAGRTAAAAGLVSKIGLASGPLVAGQLLGDQGDYGMLINVALVTLLLSMLVMLVPARLLDIRQPD